MAPYPDVADWVQQGQKGLKADPQLAFEVYEQTSGKERGGLWARRVTGDPVGRVSKLSTDPAQPQVYTI